MSYGMSAALQMAVYEHLQADAALTGLVGTAIYDALPVGELPETYVALGPEDVRDKSDVTSDGAEHRLIVSIVTKLAGFGSAKTVAAAVSDALDDADLTLTRGHLVGLWFERASARRSGPSGRLRRIDMRFRARVEDN